MTPCLKQGQRSGITECDEFTGNRMVRVSLQLFGGLRARFEGGAEIVPAGRKAQALLAYLALNPKQRCTRDRSAGLRSFQTTSFPVSPRQCGRSGRKSHSSSVHTCPDRLTVAAGTLHTPLLHEHAQ